MEGMIRVLLADDHPLILDAVSRLLTTDTGIDVVGLARDSREAAAMIKDLKPDVVVCDVAMESDAAGLDLLVAQRRVRPPIFLMLSSFDYPSTVRACYEAGAAGYLLKTTGLEKIRMAVQAVADGGTVYSADLLAMTHSAAKRPSERELELLDLLLTGATNAQIAERLVITENTVESHLRRLFGRYQTFNRGELVALAIREGWIRPV